MPRLAARSAGGTSRKPSPALHFPSAQTRTSFRFVSENQLTTARWNPAQDFICTSFNGPLSQPRCQTTCPRHAAGTQNR